jgi:hypothetical protein
LPKGATTLRVSSSHIVRLPAPTRQHMASTHTHTHHATTNTHTHTHARTCAHRSSLALCIHRVWTIVLRFGNLDSRGAMYARPIRYVGWVRILCFQPKSKLLTPYTAVFFRERVIIQAKGEVWIVKSRLWNGRNSILEW